MAAARKRASLTQSPGEAWTDDLPVCTMSGRGFSVNQRYRQDGGRREDHEFEDRSFLFCVDNQFLYGVFDGHDGARASDFAAQRLPAELLLGQLSAYASDKEVCEALRQAFTAVEKGFFQSIDDALAEKTNIQMEMPEGMSSYDAVQQFPDQVARLQGLQEEIAGGTTAVVALVHRNKLYVANVGDSRALLCIKEGPGKQYKVEQLSIDHDTDNEQELLRLSKLGLDITKIQRGHRVGNQQTTRSIGDYCVKGGYKDFDVLSVSKGEPVIAEPYIVGGIPLDENIHFLVLMSDGVYKSLEDAIEKNDVNELIVQMVAAEMQVQSTLNGVSQAVVDKVCRFHHDSFISGMQSCMVRDDMTLLVRIFNAQLPSSPRHKGIQDVQKILPVTVPYNPESAGNGGGGVPHLKMPKTVQQTQPVSSTPSSTTSTPTNSSTDPVFTQVELESQMNTTSSPTAPRIADTIKPAADNLQRAVDDAQTKETENNVGASEQDQRIDSYVDFSEFFEAEKKFGKEVVWGDFTLPDVAES